MPHGVIMNGKPEFVVGHGEGVVEEVGRAEASEAMPGDSMARQLWQAAPYNVR